MMSKMFTPPFIKRSLFLKSIKIAVAKCITAMLLLFTIFIANKASSQVSITALPQTYTQNFDGLGTATIGTFTPNTTLAGWYITTANLLINTGTNNAANCYNFGVLGTNPLSDRALGAVSTGTTHRFGLRMLNSSGASIESFTINFTGEQWRSFNAGTLVFEYQVGVVGTPITSITAGSWTPFTSLDFTSLQTSGGAQLDGNNTANRTAITAILPVTVVNTNEIMFRWTRAGTSSPGLAIDDLSVTANPIPVITTVGTLAAVSTTYGTASATPTTFTVAGTNIIQATGVTVTAPAGYEVSLTSGSGYASAINVGAAGTFSAVTVYVRLAATTNVVGSPYTGNIVSSSTTAVSKNVATASSTVSPKALSITASNVNKNFGLTLTGGAGSTAFSPSGLVGAQTIGSVTIAYGTGSAAGAAVATYTGQVTASAATGGTFTASNYTITYTAGDITVVAVVPTLTTPTATLITNTSATLGANITSNGGAALTARGTSYKTSAGVIATDNQLVEGATTTGVYTHSRSPLSPETRYYYVCYASNSAGTAISSESNFYTLSNPPTAQAANFTASTIAYNQIDLAWDAATFPASGATVKGYVLLRAQGATPVFSAANGTVPSASTGVIVSSTILDPAIYYANTGLTQNLSYTYLLVPYTWDGTNAATYSYLTAAALTATAVTPIGPCTPPVTQATAAAVAGATASTLNISWVAGTGTNSFVIVRAGSAVNQAPVTGTAYTANAVFGAGDNLGTSNFVCYNGTGTSFTLTGLSAVTTYYVSIYTYNVSGYCFNTTGPTTNNGITLAAPSVIETFEPGSKGAYATATAVCALGTWTFTDALIGTTAGSDRYVGTRSARLINNGSITMEFDKANGLGTVQIQHAVFSTNGNSTWRMDVSDDGGATFTAYQSPIQTSNSTTLTTVNFTPNITGNLIRIRIVKLTGGSDKINIDQISLGDYVSTNTIATSAIVGSPFCITNITGAAVTVPFTSVGIYNAGNVYTAQLSDATGSFTLAQDIGTLTSIANSGSIAATIPAGTVTGSAYKIRVVASDPAIVGSASATTITINLNTPDVINVNGGPANTAATVAWTNPAGCYNDVMVFASTSSITCTPVGNGSAYTANATYGSGTNCSSAFAVYQGASNTVTVNGLTNGVTYFFKVFVRNGTVWSVGTQITVVPSTVADGDYQSHQTGAYNSTATWEKRVSGAWQYPSPDLPGTGNAGTASVTVNNGHTVNMSLSASTSAIKNFTVNAGGTFYGSNSSNTYITLYGDIICNGTIGLGSATYNSASFNVEGINSTISGTGVFNASRIRKQYAVNSTTNLIVAMNVNLIWNSGSGTTLYNNINTTTFNVTVNTNATLSAILAGATSGNIAINATNGAGGDKAGTYTINGTMNIPGTLYATTNNTNVGRSCNWIIGNTGVVNCNQINCDASGASTHTFTILNGGRLNINTTVGFNTTTATSYSTTNNTFDLQAGSIVEYSAPSGITHILTDLAYSNLIVSGSGTKDFIDKNLAQSALTLTVNKNLTITGSSVLDPATPTLTNPSNSIAIGGNWINYATAGFNEAFSNVTFNGFSGAQKIYCPGGENFYNLSVTNNTVSGVELNTDVTVSNDATLGAVGRLFFGTTPNILRLSKMSPASNSLIGTAGSLIDMSASASTLIVGCQNLNYTGSLNCGTTSLVNYNRDAVDATSGGSGAQTIQTGFNYANLSFSGSDAKSTDDDFTVGNTLTVDGATTSLEATVAGRTLFIGGDINLSGGGTMGGAVGTSCLNNLSIATSGNLTQTFSGGFNPINCYNLSCNKTAGGITLAASSSNLTITNNLTQVNASLLSPNDNRVKIGNAWTIPGNANFAMGASTVEYFGTVTQTVVPVNYYNLESSSTGARTMSTTGTIGIANTFTPFTNVYTFTSSTVDYNGSINQNIAPFTANTAVVGRTYENLTLSNGSTIKTITAATDVEGALTLSNSITLALGNNFVNLKSTATKTARVATVSATANITYGTGKFVVERYYPGRRSWRLITAPVTVTSGAAGNTFYNSYQLAGVPSASAPIGSGTYITGPTSGVGLDVSPQNNFSLKTFNEATGNFDGVLNTKTLSISGSAGVATVPDNVGYFMFVRGDRSLANVNAFTPGAVVNETTLRDTGLIQIKAYTFPANAIIGSYKLIGNPYASPVDFALITKNNVADKCWTWDPNLNVVGGYVLFDAASSYAPIKVPLTNTGTVQQTQVIQSKQAFLVETTGASAPAVTFNETNKSTTNNLLAFRPVTRRNAPVLAINLYQQNANNSSLLTDGAVVQCAPEFANAIDALDGIKFTNINENIGIVSHNKVLMLERRKPFTKGDTVFLKVNRVTPRTYQLQLLGKDVARNNLSAYLVDAYTKSSTTVNLAGETLYQYEVNSNTASANPNRFYIVFAKTIHYTKVQATIQQNDIAIQWDVQDETNMVKYEVEKSTSNIDFEGIGTQNANNNSETVQYQLIDAKPIPGIYYYRIKATNRQGQIIYSNAVQVKLVNTAKEIYVFPNPVTTATIQLQLNHKVAGAYSIQLVQANGQIALQTIVMHKGGTATLAVALPENMANGNYMLTVREPNKKATIIPVFVSKK